MLTDTMKLPYHHQDVRWKYLGAKDYNMYLKWYVVKGHFHSLVPKDVVESYSVAEYMMAHSWYHYPLYSEAFSKLLLIIEMAVKLRCQQLDIPLLALNKKKGREEAKRLELLMADLCKAEPEKGLEHQFKAARKLRNSMMHPKQHTYSGGMTRNTILAMVVMLNKMFLPRQLWRSFQQQLEFINRHWTTFHNGLFVLQYNNQRCLIEGIDINAALPNEDNWMYHVIARPVLLNIGEQMATHRYDPQIMLTLTHMEFENAELRALDSQSNLPVVVTPSDHPDNIAVYHKFTAEKEAASEDDRMIYEGHH